MRAISIGRRLVAIVACVGLGTFGQLVSAKAATPGAFIIEPCTVSGSVGISPGLDVTPNPGVTTFTFNASATCTGQHAGTTALTGTLTCSSGASLAGPCAVQGDLNETLFGCLQPASGVQLGLLLLVQCNVIPSSVNAGFDFAMVMVPTPAQTPVTSALLVGGGTVNS